MMKITSTTDQLKIDRQARYRAKLRKNGEPEADRVDIALASAVAAFADAVDNNHGTQADAALLRVLLQSTLNILHADGFDKELSVKVLRRRITRVVRPEIKKFVENGKTIELLNKRK